MNEECGSKMTKILNLMVVFALAVGLAPDARADAGDGGSSGGESDVALSVTSGGSVTNRHQTLQAAFGAIGANGTGSVIPLADIDLGTDGAVELPNGADLTLDLNGKWIAQTSETGKAAVYMHGAGKLTIDDSLGGGGISSVRTAATETNSAIVVYSDGSADLTVNGGTFNVTSTNQGVICVGAEKYGTVIISNGTFSASTTGEYGYTVQATHGGLVTVAGGTFDVSTGGGTAAALESEHSGSQMTIVRNPTVHDPTGPGWNLNVQVQYGGNLDFSGYTGSGLGALGAINGDPVWVKGDLTKFNSYRALYQGYYSVCPANGDVMGDHSLVANLDAATKDEYPWMVGRISTIVPSAVADATFTIYTNGAPVAATSTFVATNTPVYVVYTANTGYRFAGGATAYTNTLDTTVNPATAPDVRAPQVPVEYVAPVYKGTDFNPTNGIARWETNTVYVYETVASSDATVTWGPAGATNWYVVTNGEFRIDGGVFYEGHLRLILSDGAKLTVTNSSSSGSGIYPSSYGTTSLAIYGQRNGTGALVAYGGDYASGIACRDGSQCSITLNGGKVTATGGKQGAGIGGGTGSAASGITVNGGTVTATCGECAAGIGGGFYGIGSFITLNGGVVTAVGGKYGAGIGGGDSAAGTNIVINGGVVTAMGGADGSGIGGGSGGSGTGIAINAGVVTATGGERAAGIGGGNGGAASAISLNGGTIAVTAPGQDNYRGDLIGSGNYGAASSNVTVSADAKVLFNLTDSTDALPAALDGFTILTPMTQTVSRILIGGCGGDGPHGVRALPVFALTNAETAATGTIEVDGGDVQFAAQLMNLPFADGKLTLNIADSSRITTPVSVAHATATAPKVYTNGVEITVGADGFLVRSGADVTVVYTADAGYFFAGGATAYTNTLDTTVNPATAPAVRAPQVPVEYVAPVYKGSDSNPTNGIARWETNTVYVYESVASSGANVTWGADGATNWYVVTGEDVAITNGVRCAGHVRLILADGARLTVTNQSGTYFAGIMTDAEGSFVVYGQRAGTGALSAFGDWRSAGIGGKNDAEGSHITLNGGIVTAVGGAEAAGIGSGGSQLSTKLASDITINRGRVTATGGYGGAGIGGASDGAARGVTVNGGRVTATGGEHAAGIGGGSGGSASAIALNGGTVVVTAPMFENAWGDLIGSGCYVSSSSGVTVSSDVRVLFNLTDSTDALPASFDGFTILTPMTQTVNRVLIGGCSGDGPHGVRALPAFVLTNVATAATGTISVDGGDVQFAANLMNLPYADGKLTLSIADSSLVEMPVAVAHATATAPKVYTNGVEITVGSDGFRVRPGTDVTVVYTADDGFFFLHGATVYTNTLDTTVSPATAPTVCAPQAPFAYV